jgi:hypothetical protein
MCNCCTSCGDTWFGSKSTSVNWIRTTTSNLPNVCSIHSALPIPCNLAKFEPRRTPATYPDCIQGSTTHPPSTSDCRWLNLLSESTYSSTWGTVRNVWRKPTYHSSFGRQLRMLACESSKAPTTLSKLFEAGIAFNHLRLLQVGLLLSWVLAKKV